MPVMRNECLTSAWIGPAFNLGMRATMLDSISPPEILVHDMATPDDVDKLLNMCVCSRCSDVQILLTLSTVTLSG